MGGIGWMKRGRGWGCDQSVAFENVGDRLNVAISEYADGSSYRSGKKDVFE
jgi:hypothetical protein